MEKTKEEYIELLKKRRISEKDLPNELLSDEDFVRQVFEFNKFIAYRAKPKTAAKIFREQVKSKPFVIANFPPKVLLLCEQECVQALSAKVPFKENLIKNCPKEILINNPELCSNLLQEGIAPNNFPQEVLSSFPPEYIEELREKARINKKMKMAQRRTNKTSSEIPNQAKKLNIKAPNQAKKYYSREVLIKKPELARDLIKKGTPLELIPIECQIQYQELCIQHLNGENYESNFKHLADEIKLKHMDICIAALKRLGKVNRDGYLVKNEDIYNYIPDKFYRNLNFIKAVMEFDSDIFGNIPKENYTDIQFVQELLQLDKKVAKYIDSTTLKKLLGQDEIKIGAEWQEECLLEINDKQNVILSSPTGSGKTNVFLEWAKQKQEKPIFITSPLISLSNERWEELKQQGFTVGIETGNIKNVPENCDFICCTQEIYTNKYLNQENATLIIDEFHYIFENQKRARAYVDALHNSKAKNILLCSATLGNVKKLTKYINKVSGREFYSYKNDSRLTQLNFEGHIDKAKIKNALVVTFTQENCKSICNSLKEARTKKSDEEIEPINAIATKYGLNESELMEYVKFGVAYYYGKMLGKEKLFIAELFRNKLIDTVAGTDALAMGVNFPIQNVVFAQLEKNGSGIISKNLFYQLAGRAGRKGFFDEGVAYYCDDFIDKNNCTMELNGHSISDLYYELLLKENEKISIFLQPKIKELLLGETTVQEEAEYIFKYSKGCKGTVESIGDWIVNKIEDIQNYDLINEVINEESSLEEASIEQIEDRKKELMPIQEEFRENIARVYFNEFSEKENCRIFKDILLGKNLNYMLEEYCSAFQDLLQFRKYVYGLPRRYRVNMKIAELEKIINDQDVTALNVGRGAISISEIQDGISEEILDTESCNRVLSEMASSVTENEPKYGNSQIGE